MNYEGLEEQLLDHLLASGFPRESLILQPSFKGSGDRWLSPDIVVIDPETQHTLAVFETKKLLSEVGDAAGAAVLETFASAEKLPESAPLLLVATTPAAPNKLLFFRLKGGKLDPIDAIPSYESLLALKRGAAKQAVAQEKREVRRGLFWTSVTVAAVGVLLFVLDALCERLWQWQLLTTPRLIVAGVAALVLVLPYFARLKVAGVELEILAAADSRVTANPSWQRTNPGRSPGLGR